MGIFKWVPTPLCLPTGPLQEHSEFCCQSPNPLHFSPTEWVLDPWPASLSLPSGWPPLAGQHAGHHHPHSQPWVHGDTRDPFSDTLGIYFRPREGLGLVQCHTAKMYVGRQCPQPWPNLHLPIPIYGCCPKPFLPLCH